MGEFMAYLRWSCSEWYVFWTSNDHEVENRDNARVCIDCRVYFNAWQLRDDFDKCVDEVVQEKGPMPQYDIDELRDALKTFLDDVNQEYPE